MAGTCWIFADAHGGTDPQHDDSMLAVLDAAADEGVDLILLGDLFLVWLAVDHFLTDFQRAVVRRLRAIREAGARVRFVVGNRDYLIEEGGLFDEAFDEAVVNLGGVPTLLTHGDQINGIDRGYVWWRRVSRSAPSRMLLQSLPAGPAIWMAERLEARIRPVRQKYRSGHLPGPALRRLGRRARVLGAERAIVGHFHTERVIEVPGGAPVYIAPAWLMYRRMLRVNEDGSLESFSPL